MIDRNVIDEIGRKISAVLPDGSEQIQRDVEGNVHAILQATLSKLNLVTREEFDVQTALLERTRERLIELEKKLEELDQN